MPVWPSPGWSLCGNILSHAGTAPNALWSDDPKPELKKARGGPDGGHEHASPERSACTQSGRFVHSR